MPVFGNYSCDLYFWRLLNVIKRQRRPCKHWGKSNAYTSGKTFMVIHILETETLSVLYSQITFQEKAWIHCSISFFKILRLILKLDHTEEAGRLCCGRERGFLHPLTLAQRHGRSPSKYLTWCLDPIRLFQRDTCMMLKDQDKSCFVRDLNKQLCTKKHQKMETCLIKLITWIYPLEDGNIQCMGTKSLWILV